MFNNVIMPLLPPGERHLTWELVKVWLYRGSFFVSVLLLIGFSAVLPIDSIAQASVSDNNALNTFIVVGAIVCFFIICIVVIVGRMIYRKSCLIDIPRRYLPVTSADLPQRESREYILQNMDRSKEMGLFFEKPKDPVVHDGLEPPLRCDVRSSYHTIPSENNNNNHNNNNKSMNKVFPEFLNYETCMKVVSNRIKYQGYLLSVINLELETQDTFGDIITKQFITESDVNQIQVAKAKRFIDLYQYLQYSGKSIKREEFIEFVELTIYFADIIATSDQSVRADINADTLTQLNTTSNQTLRYHKNGITGVNTPITSTIDNEDNNSTISKRRKWNDFKFKHTEDYDHGDGDAVIKRKNNSHPSNNINYEIDDDDDDSDGLDPAIGGARHPSYYPSLRDTPRYDRPVYKHSGTETDFATDVVSYFPSGSSLVRRNNSTGSVAKNVNSSHKSSFSSDRNSRSLNEISKSSGLSDREIHKNINKDSDRSDIPITKSINSMDHHT